MYYDILASEKYPLRDFEKASPSPTDIFLIEKYNIQAGAYLY